MKRFCGIPNPVPLSIVYLYLIWLTGLYQSIQEHRGMSEKHILIVHPMNNEEPPWSERERGREDKIMRQISMMTILLTCLEILTPVK